jgi:hypothetical protein
MEKGLDVSLLAIPHLDVPASHPVPCTLPEHVHHCVIYREVCVVSAWVGEVSQVTRRRRVGGGGHTNRLQQCNLPTHTLRVRDAPAYRRTSSTPSLTSEMSSTRVKGMIVEYLLVGDKSVTSCRGGAWVRDRNGRTTASQRPQRPDKDAGPTSRAVSPHAHAPRLL